MGGGPELSTERLLLRRWRDCDREPYAALNADPQVREFFPEVLTRQQSDAQIAVFEDHFEAHGFGMWALELRASGELIGFTGMDLATYNAHFAPAARSAGGWSARPGSRLRDRGRARHAGVRLFRCWSFAR